MRRLNLIWSIAIVIVLPIAIILLAGNVVLRVPATYTYHFNDSQAVGEVGSSITGTEFADEIAGYFNSIKSEEFQIYEENGEFKDPVFDEVESSVMRKCKSTMIWTLFLGIVLFGLSIALYLYLMMTLERPVLRFVGFLSLGVSFLDVLIVGFLIMRSSFRAFLYEKFIGISLGKETTFHILLGSPFEKSYLIFSSVLAIVIICILLYIHYSVTRERRLFS